jgi:hypothetical protein
MLQEGTYYIAYADGNTPAIASVDARIAGYRRWYHYNGARTSDSLRIYYEYSGDDPGTSQDDMGQPLSRQHQRLYDKDFFFLATLHASAVPYNPSTPYSSGTYITSVDPNDQDDMNQPTVTTVANIQNVLTGLPLYSTSFVPSGSEGQNYYSLASGLTLASQDMAGADVRPGHHRTNPDELGITDVAAAGPGISENQFRSMIVAYGPYEFGPNQQIRIVKASGIAGISREKAMEIGKEYLAGTLQDPPNMKNPTTGSLPATFAFPLGATESERRRDRWFSTGIDSVHLTVSRAIYNFRHNYNIPVSPPPPDSIEIKPLAYGIKLTWKDAAAENRTNFQGYRIIKKVSSYDSIFYKEIYRSDPTDKAPVHTFVDSLVRILVANYYYIQAGVKIADDDTNAHPSERGKIMWSSMIWYLNNTTSANQGATPPSLSNRLNEIVIAPNPFNWNEPTFKKYKLQNPNDLRIVFFNLPPVLTIRIFTEYGDLIKVVEHVNGSGNEEWNMTNQIGKTVASGIYIVVFQTPEGTTSYQKLVIAR